MSTFEASVWMQKSTQQIENSIIIRFLRNNPSVNVLVGNFNFRPPDTNAVCQCIVKKAQ